MIRISKSAFRKFICSTALGDCEILHGSNGCMWVRNGKPVAARHDILFFHTYYLEA